MCKIASKLAEAKHFLAQMEETLAEKEIFQYNLSAFLSAFRSIYYYLQTEYNDSAEYRQWYKGKIKAYKGTVMETLTLTRDKNVHTEPVVTHNGKVWKTTWDLEFGPETIGPLVMAGRLRQIGPNSYETTNPPTTVEQVRQYFESSTGKDVVLSGRNALRLAEADIDECQRTFTKS